MRHGDVLLAVAKDLVEERAQLTLLAGEVELGVVGQRLGQVQLDEPDQSDGQGQGSCHVKYGVEYIRVGEGPVWSDIRSGRKLTCPNRELRWPLPAVPACISQCLPCFFLLPEI